MKIKFKGEITSIIGLKTNTNLISGGLKLYVGVPIIISQSS